MKLLLKFNLIFVLVFSAGLALSGYFANEFLQRNARDQVAQQARLTMETALAARTYSTSQIKTFAGEAAPKWSARDLAEASGSRTHFRG